MEAQYLAFYGTLKRGQTNSLDPKVYDELEFVGPCVIPGRLYDLGRLHGLKKGDGAVPGELFKLPHLGILETVDEFHALDVYEAVDNEDPKRPGFYREHVTLIEPKLEAWVYLYDGPVTKRDRITK